jgi:hypothetical protein
MPVRVDESCSGRSPQSDALTTVCEREDARSRGCCAVEVVGRRGWKVWLDRSGSLTKGCFAKTFFASSAGVGGRNDEIVRGTRLATCRAACRTFWYSRNTSSLERLVESHSEGPNRGTTTGCSHFIARRAVGPQRPKSRGATPRAVALSSPAPRCCSVWRPLPLCTWPRRVCRLSARCDCRTEFRDGDRRLKPQGLVTIEGVVRGQTPLSPAAGRHSQHYYCRRAGTRSLRSKSKRARDQADRIRGRTAAAATQAASTFRLSRPAPGDRGRRRRGITPQHHEISVGRTRCDRDGDATIRRAVTIRPAPLRASTRRRAPDSAGGWLPLAG